MCRIFKLTKEVKKILISWDKPWHIKKRYSLTQRIIFLKQLHIILKSGISILKGITILEKRVAKPLDVICKRLLIDLQAGKPLAEAMNRNTDFFPNLIITLVAAGEQSGELPYVLQALIEYYSKQKELGNFIIKALIYPVFLIVASISVMLFFLMYVLPVLATTYTAMQAQPSSFLKTAITLHSYLHGKSYLLLFIVISILAALYLSQPYVKKVCLHINWCKHFYNLILEARFCKLLALLLNSGINITEAIVIAGKTINDQSMLNKLQLYKEYLQRGYEINTAIEHTQGLFSPLTEELITIGATTGYLPQMLEEAAKIAEEDLRDYLDRLREFLAPTLLLIAATLTAGIIVSIMGPLFELFTAIPEY